MAHEFEWSMRLVRFVLSRGCVEAEEEGAGQSGHRHRGQCADRTIMTVSAVLTVASEVIRRMTVQENVVADAGWFFNIVDDDDERE